MRTYSLVFLCCTVGMVVSGPVARGEDGTPATKLDLPAARQLNRAVENALGVSPASGAEAVDAFSQWAKLEAAAQAAQIPVVSHMDRDGVRAELAATAAILRNAEGKPDLAEFRQVAPRLYALHQSVVESDALTAAEQQQFRLQIRTRLFELGDKIVETARRHQGIERRAARSEGRNAATQMEQFSLASLASGGGLAAAEPYPWLGGAAEREAAKLIELIRTTIQPEHWDVNGGPGAMFYYAPTHSLVVRASLEVHWAIGGMRAALGNR